MKKGCAMFQSHLQLNNSAFLRKLKMKSLRLLRLCNEVVSEVFKPAAVSCVSCVSSSAITDTKGFINVDLKDKCFLPACPCFLFISQLFSWEKLRGQISSVGE